MFTFEPTPVGEEVGSFWVPDEDEFAFYDVRNVAGKPIWRASSPSREDLFHVC